MDKIRRLELIERCLGIRHKLKVHESGKAPDNHVDIALMLLSKWELEDELHAIEEILAEARRSNVQAKKIAFERNDYHIIRKAERIVDRSLSDQN